MKEQIYNIITKNVNATPVGKGNSVIGIIPASEEITDHVFQFMGWLVLHCTGDIFYLGYDENDNVIWYNIDDDKKYTKNELYNFWYSNVFSKTKKG